MSADPKLIVALDFAEAAPAMELVAALEPCLCRLKVGKEMFTRLGPGFVQGLVARGFDVFLDLKYHDIPNTVAKACAAAADLGVWMLNVHALGGRRMMEAAREALEGASTRPLLIAVTILTSLEQADLEEIGIQGSPADAVRRLALLAARSGTDGVVCSPREVGDLRLLVPEEFLLVTPGIRPADSGQDDQKRVLTPVEALRQGSDYLVIGRPITAHPDPLQRLREINASL